MHKEHHVYCTSCIYFRLCDENKPYCIYENKCDINNCEDSKPYENRPHYEPNYILSKKEIYISGILSEMRSTDDVIDAMEYGRLSYDHSLYTKRDTLQFELDKVRKMDGEIEINERKEVDIDD